MSYVVPPHGALVEAAVHLVARALVDAVDKRISVGEYLAHDVLLARGLHQVVAEAVGLLDVYLVVAVVGQHYHCVFPGSAA